MKKIVFIVSIFLYSIFIYAQEFCDTLKIKILETYYYEHTSSDDFKVIGKLDGAEINIDSFPSIIPSIKYCNVSIDTFKANTSIFVYLGIFVYNYGEDTAVFVNYRLYDFSHDFLPYDTFHHFTELYCDVWEMISALEQKGKIIDKRTHWKMIITIPRTDKDGFYSERVFYAGADTSTFYITRNEVNINALETEEKYISVFPNPAQSQFTVTNVKDAVLRLYNTLGQEVVCIRNEKENAIINTNHLPQGLYVLKVEKENAVLTRKVQTVW
jgi:hypothetical protein